MPRRGDIHLTIGGDSKQWESTLRRSGQASKRFSRNVDTNFSRLGGKLGKVGGRFASGLVAPFAAMAGGAIVYQAGRQIIGFESDLTRLSIQAGKSAEEQIALKKEIVDTGIETGQLRDDVLGGISAMVEKNGDLEFARNMMKDIGIASTATGASFADMGILAVQLRDKMGLAGGEIKTALNTLTVQGKAGAFTLENLAGLGERLFTSAGRLGIQGMGGIREFGAFAQVARMGTGSAEQATTAVERVMASIIDKQDQIGKLGFNIFEDKDAQKYKSLSDILKGTIKAAKGNEKILGKIFGEEGIRGVSTLAKAYRETKGFALFDELVTADSERAGELMKDFARYSTSTSYQLKVLAGIGQEFADEALAPIIADLTSNIRELTSDPEKMKKFRESVKEVAVTFAEVGQEVVMIIGKITELLPLLDAMVDGAKIIHAGGRLIQSPFAMIGQGLEHYENLANWKDAAVESRSDAAAYNARALQEAAASAQTARHGNTNQPSLTLPESAWNKTDVYVSISGEKVTARTESSNGKSSTTVRDKRGSLHVK